MITRNGLTTSQSVEFPRILSRAGGLLLVCLTAGILSSRGGTPGTVATWGDTSFGQLNPPGVLAISAGDAFNLALMTNGAVVAWGNNYYGQTNVPAGLGGVVAIAAGEYHSLALKADGTLMAWGRQTDVPPGLDDVIAVEGGGDYSMALKADGTVVAWGDNYYGQTNLPAGLNGVVAISASPGHGMALKTNGAVVAWGNNSSGQTNVPAGLSGVVAISAGGYHSLALKADGTVVAWGYNKSGQTNVPAGLNGVVAISAGGNHNLALKTNGTVVAWGRNAGGETNVPPGLSGVVAVAAGYNYSLALFGASPTVVAGSATKMAYSGTTVFLRSAAAGAWPLRYQWRFNGTNVVAGATNAVLQLTSLQVSQSGSYTLVVTNGLGSATSAPTLLTVIDAAPQIIKPPAMADAWLGSTADFSVEAIGSLPMRYQWFFQGTNLIAGATGTALALTNLQSWQTGGYTVVVTNAYGAATSASASLTFVPLTTVPYRTEAALRAALAAGPAVTLAYDGEITLSNTITMTRDATLDGTGHQATISGGNLVRVFMVNSNVTFTLNNLTIAAGRSTQGAGIYNFGTLALTGCSFITNTASNPSGVGSGGAIYNAGVASANGCMFQGNQVIGGGMYNANRPGSDALGGAICNPGVLDVDSCTFAQNSAVAGQGDGLFCVNGVAPGYPGGMAAGGALCSSGLARLRSCTISSNTATGGTGGDGSSPGNCYMNIPGGPGGLGGPAVGGVYGSFSATNCTFMANIGQGGTGGQGGFGFYYPHSYGPGGPGGEGGNGWGAFQGSGTLANCTLALNAGNGGSGGPGGLSGGSPGASGLAGGGITGGVLLNTIVASNSPANRSGSSLLPADLGHNLSSDASCQFTNVGSLNGTDARIGSLTNNGGPTLTMALWPDSPAIDGGDTAAAPATDQRGFPRPAGRAADIGAYELAYPPILRISPPEAGTIGVRIYGTNGQPYRLFTGPDLSHWTPVATNQIGSDGTVWYYDNAGAAAGRFYRLVLP